MRVVRTKHSLPDDWWSQDVGPAESAGAHWEIGWDDELASFYAQLLMDYSPGEQPEGYARPPPDFGLTGGPSTDKGGFRHLSGPARPWVNKCSS
jgi:hypothetical protein